MEKFVDRAMLMCCQLGDLWVDGDFESRQQLQKLVFPSGIFLDKENCNYRTISLSQMSKGELACTLPWREIVGTANNFMKDFLKVVDFLHYFKAEGYDMETFKKVRDDL